MGRFNLVEEPWIAVLDNDSGERIEVSLLDLFENARKYRCLAGEMETQNFAVLRLLLSIIQTVFSRFDVNGEYLPGVKVDNRYVQVEPVDEDDKEDYIIALEKNWSDLFSLNEFPKIVSEYLKCWRDRFFLFDDEHPFYQVNEKLKDELIDRIPDKKSGTFVKGDSINRTISQSNRDEKIAIFSPVSDRFTEYMSSDEEFTRWLIMFQGYPKNGGRTTKLKKSGQKGSKGWLLDIGGIYLEGETLFRTLIFNYIPVLSNNKFVTHVQHPCWELDEKNMINRLLNENMIDNLSELYTNWSRAIYVNPNWTLNNPVEMEVIELPRVDHTENSVEPMTLWQKNDDKDENGYYSPKKHNPEEALWRSFGIITMKDEKNRENYQTGIYQQFERIAKVVGSRWTDIVGVGVKNDSYGTIEDEISDVMVINDIVMADDEWITRINDVVEKTKNAIENYYGNFLREIMEMRNPIRGDKKKKKKRDLIIKRYIEGIYYDIDPKFNEWLSDIKPKDDKEEKILSWNNQILNILKERANYCIENCMTRDINGIVTRDGDKKEVKNIFGVYVQFISEVHRCFRTGGRS